jgi:hypothetical protein
VASANLGGSARHGTVKDYQRAAFFQTGEHRNLSRFWYRTPDGATTRFMLVDPEKNTSGPAFDSQRIADELKRVSKRAYDADNLPFEEFEFTKDGKAIRFTIDDKECRCELVDYVSRAFHQYSYRNLRAATVPLTRCLCSLSLVEPKCSGQLAR